MALVAMASCGPAPASYSTSCPPGYVIVLIHGSGSAGHFDPNDPVVSTLNTSPGSAATAGRNKEFDDLLGDARSCAITFSYDNVYLGPIGAQGPGLAWNDVRSPWNRQPDELAANLEHLRSGWLNEAPNARFVFVAYSAGGIVPTYWAATRTSALGTSHVDAIVVIDGIVSGSTNPGFAWGCANLRDSLLDHDWPGLGKAPCQFLRSSEYTTAVRDSGFWDHITFATLRAEGDVLVPHGAAGLDPTPAVVRDPDIRQRPCLLPGDWMSLGVVGCLLGHGGVLKHAVAKETLHSLIP